MILVPQALSVKILRDRTNAPINIPTEMRVQTKPAGVESVSLNDEPLVFRIETSTTGRITMM